MVVTPRTRGKGSGKPPGHCSAQGCIRSASYDAIFLGTDHVPLCRRCKDEWLDAYEHALFGWPDDAKAAA